jgi:predicted dehydrogenase
MKKTVRIGLVGSGFMGRTHALGFRSVGGVFDLPLEPVLELLADATDELAATAAARYGFARSVGDWHALVEDPAVDVVDITAPNKLHAPISLAALALGKAVYCEKPLAPNADEALAMVQAAERAGVVTQVGFNYICNPMLALAREMIEGGELGAIWGFRGIHAEDFMINRRRSHRRYRQPHHRHGALPAGTDRRPLRRSGDGDRSPSASGPTRRDARRGG